MSQEKTVGIPKEWNIAVEQLQMVHGVNTSEVCKRALGEVLIEYGMFTRDEIDAVLSRCRKFTKAGRVKT